ncbi:MAG: hypothetical protein MUC87_03230 [Bacteroidia bacterium]|jgi:hypothetical protein|nr:hypothetical protein [Bacteroidia bacterium]
MKIGLIGESPNDTQAFINLFKRQYPNHIEYKSLITNFKGGNLDNVDLHNLSEKETVVLNQLKREYISEQPDFVVYIRDSDALENEPELEERLNRIYKLGNAIGQNVTYLICIFEMETLLLADTDCVNNFYNTSFIYPNSSDDPTDPMHRKEPKELLISECGYRPIDCPRLFTTINFQKLLQVRFFAEFVAQFEHRIKNIA